MEHQNETLFIYQDLWELVEKDCTEKEVSGELLRDHRKRYAKAFFFILQVVDETIFPYIEAATKSKKAWDLLQKHFQGTSKVKTIKLKNLRRNFEGSFMKDRESLDAYSTKLSEIVNQMRKYNEGVSEHKLVEKMLRSLPRKYEHIWQP